MMRKGSKGDDKSQTDNPNRLTISQRVRATYISISSGYQLRNADPRDDFVPSNYGICES